MITHQPYPSDVSDAEWAFVVLYLCLLPEGSGQRVCNRAYAEADAASYGIQLHVVSLPEANADVCFYRAVGWWSGRTVGWRDFVAWRGTTSGSVRPSRGCTMWLSAS